MSDQVPSAPRRWLLPVCLVAAGLACLAIAWFVTQPQLADWMEQRLAHAQGSLSAETSAWLRGPDLCRRFAWTGASLIVAGILSRVFRGALRQFGRRLTCTNDAAPLPSWFMPVVAGGLVFLWFFPTLRHGYFRYDDFELLTVAQAKPLAHALGMLHGDHFLPLTRVLFYLAYHIFGVTAWPYNLWLLLCFSSLAVLGVRLLSQLRASPAAQLVFIVLVVFWSPVAEMMTGYYVLSTYLSIAVSGLMAVSCYLRWRIDRRAFDAAGILLAVTAAPLIDLSGWYVPGAVGVFVLAEFIHQPDAATRTAELKRQGRLLIGLVVLALAALVWTIYAYQVLNPGSFLGMAAGTPRTIGRLVEEFAYLFSSGLLLSMVTPFIYARLPPPLLGALAAGVLVLWLASFAIAWRRAEPARRQTLGMLLLVVLGICLMVNLGRPNADTLLVRWAAKHVVPAYVWLCLLFALSWDTIWQKIRAASISLAGEMTAIALGLFIGTQCAFGLLGMAVAFPPFGYPAEIRDAIRRRAAVEEIRDHIVRPLGESLPTGDYVPTLDGAYLQARWPSLFRYNLTHYEPFFGSWTRCILWARNPAMQSWYGDTAFGIKTVASLQDAASDFRSVLTKNRSLRSYYFADVPLEPTLTPAQTPPAGDETIVESDGTAEIPVRTTPWDPETAPRLRVALRSLDETGAGEIVLRVELRSDLTPEPWHGTLTMPADGSKVTEFDLRQVYAFALSERVEHLRLVLTKPGRYAIRLAEIVP